MGGVALLGHVATQLTDGGDAPAAGSLLEGALRTSKASGGRAGVKNGSVQDSVIHSMVYSPCLGLLHSEYHILYNIVYCIMAGSITF